MAAPKIVPIIEGDGEILAAPALIARVLHHFERYDIFADNTINAHGRGNLTKTQGLENFLEIAYRRANCGGVLVLLDSEGDCPFTLAQQLAARVQQHGARFPTAIVLANPMFEVWFLACASHLAGQKLGELVTFSSELQTPESPESERNPKNWLNRKMPRTRPYKETEDQVTLTRLLDFAEAQANSRSFRRLLHAIEELLAAIDGSNPVVSPTTNS